MLIMRGCLGAETVTGQVDGTTVRLFDGDSVLDGQPGSRTVDLADLRPLPPVDPRRILIILGGFGPRADANGEIKPLLFPKQVTGSVGHTCAVRVPPYVHRVDVEVELAVVMARDVEGATSDEVWDAVLGVTCFNDVTAPEFLSGRMDLYRAKCIDGFCSFGPWIRTDLSPVDIRRGLELVTRVNGEVVQRGNTKEFRHDVCDVLAFASRHTRLEAGDVIALGTPPPAASVSPGDAVEIEVEGIGVLRNSIRAAADRVAP